MSTAVQLPLAAPPHRNRYLFADHYLDVILPGRAEWAALAAAAEPVRQAIRARYALHTRTRRRILADLGTPGKGLNQRLTAWWDLDFAAFRAEVQKVFRH